MCLMCSCCMNLVNVSEENGGPLSVESLLGDPYWEMSDLNLGVIDSATFEDILYRNGYLQKVSAMRRYSVLLW